VPIELPPLDPVAVTADPDAVWVAAKDPLSGGTRGEVLRVDPKTRSVTATTPITGELSDIDVRSDAVWAGAFIISPNSQQLIKIDPGTGEILTTLDLGPSGGGTFASPLAVDDRSVWVPVEDGLLRVDAATHEVSALIPTPSFGFQDLVARNGTVWGVISAVPTQGAEGGLWRIDSATERVVAKLGPPGWNFRAVAVGEEGVWVYPSEVTDPA
jgi:hypothetical protein